MERTYVMIEVPMGESGVTPAPLARRLGGKSCVELVARQATDSLCIDRVVVVPGPSADDDDQAALLRECVPPDVPIFDSDQPDSLSRLLAAADAFEAEAVIRVDGSQLLVDPAFIDRLIVAQQEMLSEPDLPMADYVGYVDERGVYLTGVPRLFPEWIRAEALRRADREAYRGSDRAEVSRYILSHSRRFRWLQLPISQRDLAAARRCVSGLENNWEHAELIYGAVGAEGWDWRRIADHLELQSLHRRD